MVLISKKDIKELARDAGISTIEGGVDDTIITAVKVRVEKGHFKTSDQITSFVKFVLSKSKQILVNAGRSKITVSIVEFVIKNSPYAL